MKAYLFAVMLALAAVPTTAKACDVALLLMNDQSGSMTNTEFSMQMRGTAAAFRSEMIQNRISRGPSGYIYVRVMTFAHETHWITDWKRVGSADEAESLAAILETTQRRIDNGGTLTGAALGNAVEAFESVPEDCTRNVIDVSTDWLADDLPVLQRSRVAAQERDITINALMIYMSAEEEAEAAAAGEMSPHPPEDLVKWAERELQTGAMAFVRQTTFQTYESAIRSKLWTELTGKQPELKYSSILISGSHPPPLQLLNH